MRIHGRLSDIIDGLIELRRRWGDLDYGIRDENLVVTDRALILDDGTHLDAEGFPLVDVSACR